MAQTIFDVLEEEHRQVRAMLEEVRQDPARFKRLMQAIEAHVEAEEEVLYQPLVREDRIREQVLEAYEEHHVVGLIMRELEQNKSGTEQWNAKLKVMQENLEHHIEEEEGPLFDAARPIVGAHAEGMAREFKQAKKKVPVGV